MKYYTNRELSRLFDINLATWKRWSREFLPPDPLAHILDIPDGPADLIVNNQRRNNGALGHIARFVAVIIESNRKEIVVKGVGQDDISSLKGFPEIAIHLSGDEIGIKIQRTRSRTKTFEV